METKDGGVSRKGKASPDKDVVVLSRGVEKTIKMSEIKVAGGTPETVEDSVLLAGISETLGLGKHTLSDGVITKLEDKWVVSPRAVSG